MLYSATCLIVNFSHLPSSKRVIQPEDLQLCTPRTWVHGENTKKGEARFRYLSIAILREGDLWCMVGGATPKKTIPSFAPLKTGGNLFRWLGAANNPMVGAHRETQRLQGSIKTAEVRGLITRSSDSGRLKPMDLKATPSYRGTSLKTKRDPYRV